MDAAEQRNQYRMDAIRTASPEQLTLMLYEAALKSVEDCRDTIKSNPKGGLSTSQLARDILAALADDVNMNHAHGKTMRDLYLYCWNTLLSAAVSGNADELDSVAVVLKNLIVGLKAYRSGETDTEGAQNVEHLSINFAG